MARATSAGLLMYRLRPDGPQVLLGHPGGPFWSRKDEGAWTLPKGEVGPGEDPLAAALREFAEETGFPAAPPFHPLGELRQKGGKRVLAWACEGEADCAALRSNRFELEWPPGSGRRQSYPEIDRAAWFTLDEARRKLLPSQLPLLDRLAELMRAAVPRG